ncbi:MAG: GTPase HflX [Oscillospiraceae bacterium]|jgi:GTP-binding protein HflX|nr:GTPase HflX [Oscillospiraceae bacterium]
MHEIHENNEYRQIAVLAAIDLGQDDFELSLSELRELADTANAEIAGVITQKRSAIETATVIGSGRLAELKEFAHSNDVNLIIFDMELTPRQITNIERETDIRTIDRTMLILDIFAKRARSAEGKLQVELAQLKYMLPRLTGKGVEMSRLGAGIGTRGPGETKLETDRRHIRRRIDTLKEQLAEVRLRREQLRRRRKKDEIVTAAIVGYTNVGKSTLLNKLTDAGVLAENMLFATLDTTARSLQLPSGSHVMLIDTVGLIRNLPHHLVNAFKSTLEEMQYADILILLCDASSPEISDQLSVTNALIEELSAGGKPVVTVLNKIDIADKTQLVGLPGVKISAESGEGLDELLSEIDRAMPTRRIRTRLLLPFDKIGLSVSLRENGTIFSEEYAEGGLLLDVSADAPYIEKLRIYEQTEE